MSWVRRRHARWAAVARIGAVALTTMTMLAACGGTAAPVKLPRQSSAPAAAASSASTAVPQAAQQGAARQAYLAFWSAEPKAEDTMNAAKARTILAPYTDPDYISTVISSMQEAWGKDEVVWGAAVEHIQSVHVAALTQGQYLATVRDCQDSSHQGFANAKTGALVAGTLGQPHQQLYTSMGLVGGHWLVNNVTFVGFQCTS